ncbi:MAG TPA: hypothetical protein VLC79_13385 [Cellvibrio sp.]|nr:hypothetical protein [Cellvibrio sp.]
MNKLFSLSCGMLFGTSLLLSGCGGGSSGSKPTTPPASSAAASSVVAVTSSIAPSSTAAASSSAPATAQLTIQGSAAAEALAGGEVVFTIGAKTYKAAIDNALKYSIVLDVPDQDIDKPFFAVATGSGSNDWVQLAASYPSVAALIEKAGSDKILNANEFFGVNITSLTSAQYAELVANNPAIVTDDARKNAILELQPIRALEKAGIVSRTLSDINFNLPAQAKTTLGFLQDRNLSETYLEIFRLSNFSWLNSQIEGMQLDKSQTYVSPAKLSGIYFLEALNSQYQLTFNDDGTGQLRTGSIDQRFPDQQQRNSVAENFSWERKANTIQIQFAQAVKYTTNSYVADDKFSNFKCDDILTSGYEYCDLSFDVIELELISEAEFSKFAELRIYGEATRNNTIIYEEGVLASSFARLTSAENALALTASDIVGYEWYLDKYRYIFTADGVAKKRDLITQDESTFSWEIKNKQLIVGNTTLWPVNKNAAGYNLFYIDEKTLERAAIVKRLPVTMTEADWIGRWTGSPLDKLANAQDVNADKSWADGFESDVAGSWSVVDSHRQTAISNGAWRMNRDVLAIHGETYYLSLCHGPEEDNFIPVQCYLSVTTKAKNFDTGVFWGGWSHPAFNEKISGKAWMVRGEQVFVSDGWSNLTSKPYTRVSATRLFNPEDKTILEMTGANKTEIELCEYKLFEACNDQNKLKYQRGIQIKITTSDGGIVRTKQEALGSDGLHSYEWFADTALMLAKNTNQSISLWPPAGFAISYDSVSGCDGHLSGNEYHIPARTSDCAITINFVPLP